MVTINLSDSLKSKIWGALTKTPLGRGGGLAPPDAPDAISPIFLFFQVGTSVEAEGSR